MACPVKRSKNKLIKKEHYHPEADRLKKCFLEAQARFILSNEDRDKIDANNKKKIYDLKLKELRKKSNEAHIHRACNRSKAIWQTINNERSSKKNCPNSSWHIRKGGDTVDDIHKIAEIFNEHFINIADETLKINNSQSNNITQLRFPDMPVNDLSQFHITSSEEVLKTIQQLKPSNSAGMDEISSKVLKFCEDELCHPLADIINKSLAQGIFPSKLKISKVYPLHKQGSRHEVQNFRPISLVPSVSKIIEKIVLSRLLDHLVTNNLIPKRQHGFLAGRSTITALTDLIDWAIDNIDAENTITNVFLDLSKAFDCLDHRLIVRKLSSLGIKNVPLKWFDSYLSERQQIVVLKQYLNGQSQEGKSFPLTIRRGVPQGSVMGPVLFLLFTADLPHLIEPHSYPIMYADDTVLMTANKSIEQLEIDTFISVSMAQQYCVQNDLVFNESKTKLLVLGRNKNVISNPPNLQVVNYTKHLGVVLDDRLSWNFHVDELSVQLSTAIFALKRVKAISTEEAAKTTYYALFESRVRYGITLWGGSSCDNLKRIMILQKKAVRIMANLKPLDSCREAFKNFKIMTAASLYILEVILHASRLNLPKNKDIHRQNTRQENDFHLPTHRTALFEKKPGYAGARLFNALPTELKIEDTKKLKSSLQRWLIGKSIYCISEFFTCARGEAHY